MHLFYQNRNEKYFSKITVNNCFPFHMHREVELLYCKSGNLIVTIEGTDYHLAKGDLTICFPDLIHGIKTLDESIAYLCIFSVDFLGEFQQELLEQHPQNPLIKKEHISKQCLYLLEALEEQLNSSNDLRVSKGYLTALIGLLLPQFTMCTNRTLSNMNSCRLIINYIHDHLTCELTLEKLSKELGLSRYYISHIFSDKIGVSFPTYVNQERIDYAVKLLSNPELSITDVCFQSGFNSLRTFYRAFHAVYLKSPQEVRKQL